MAKIRHISYRAEDVDAMAKFFVDAMGMTIVQKRKDGAIDLSDGSVNISILPLAANRSRRAGLEHIGFSAEDHQSNVFKPNPDDIQHTSPLQAIKGNYF